MCWGLNLLLLLCRDKLLENISIRTYITIDSSMIVSIIL